MIQKFKDSFCSDQSDPSAFDAEEGGFVTARPPYEKKVPLIALFRDHIGESHIWKEAKFLGLNIFVSDQLKNEITERGLKVPKLYRLKEV